MAVFRIERTRDYTVMSNHHLRNANLSLKAKGLLSMMLSLPEDWNYTTRGLAKICKEGVDAIGAALRELEGAGYIVRHQRRDKSGRITDTEYVIYEQPQPDLSQPDTASPDTENPDMVKPDTEKPAELNIEKSNTQKSITHGSSTDSIPFRETAAVSPPERKGRDAMSVSEIENYRELILENIEYDYLCREFATYREDLDEIVELVNDRVGDHALIEDGLIEFVDLIRAQACDGDGFRTEVAFDSAVDHIVVTAIGVDLQARLNTAEPLDHVLKDRHIRIGIL